MFLSFSCTLHTLHEQLVVSQYRDIVAGASFISLLLFLLLPFSLFLSSFRALSSPPPIPPSSWLCLIFLLSLIVSRYRFLQDQRPIPEFHLKHFYPRFHVFAQLRNSSSSLFAQRRRECCEKSRAVRYRVTVTVCSCLRCDNDKSSPLLFLLSW